MNKKLDFETLKNKIKEESDSIDPSKPLE